MTRRRFYVPQDALHSPDAGVRVRLAPDEARHLRDVLRLRAGDEAFVFDGAGGEYRCVVAESGSGRGGSGAVLEVRERVEPLRPESPLELVLAVALLKGEKFDMIVQKATELGAACIVPVVTARADVRLRDANDAAKRTTRWQRLALEAAKQSGRARVPVIDAPAAFASVVAGGAGIADGAGEGVATLRLLFAERAGQSLDEAVGDGRSLDEAGADGDEIPAAASDASVLTVTALVGPEGGWEDAEIAQARDAGWRIITLGGRTLRAETAAVAVCVLLQHLFGDLK